jgi:fumarylacetoacetase
MDALAPFRCRAFERPAGDPQPLDYLRDQQDQALGGFDITLEVWLSTAKMRAANVPAIRISRSNAFKDMYWTLAQMLAHHTSNGCNMMPGDLLASGTISGEEPDTRGCLLESTWQGSGPDGKPLPRKAIELPTGEARTFLADGDEVTIRGWCEREGYRTIGFGECAGVIDNADQ